MPSRPLTAPGPLLLSAQRWPSNMGLLGPVALAPAPLCGVGAEAPEPTRRPAISGCRLPTPSCEAPRWK